MNQPNQCHSKKASILGNTEVSDEMPYPTIIFCLNRKNDSLSTSVNLSSYDKS